MSAGSILSAKSMARAKWYLTAPIVSIVVPTYCRLVYRICAISVNGYEYLEQWRPIPNVTDSSRCAPYIHVQVAIKYEQDELRACKTLADQCLSDDPETIISNASIAFKEQGSGYCFFSPELLI